MQPCIVDIYFVQHVNFICKAIPLSEKNTALNTFASWKVTHINTYLISERDKAQVKSYLYWNGYRHKLRESYYYRAKIYLSKT